MVQEICSRYMYVDETIYPQALLLRRLSGQQVSQQTYIKLLVITLSAIKSYSVEKIVLGILHAALKFKYFCTSLYRALLPKKINIV